MKFRVILNTPDALHEAIVRAHNDLPFDVFHNNEEEDNVAAIKELCSTWFRYDEYITVEIDTETKTCVTVPVKEL